VNRVWIRQSGLVNATTSSSRVRAVTVRATTSKDLRVETVAQGLAAGCWLLAAGCWLNDAPCLPVTGGAGWF
jgi:hypothetical protein